VFRNELYSNGQLVSAEIIDLGAGTIAFEDRGVVTSTRPLTPAEVVAYTRPAPVVSADQRLAAAKTALAAIDALPTPVLTADVVDLLDDLRSVL
jgi:hypothetical protein